MFFMKRITLGICLILACLFTVRAFAGSGGQPTPLSDEGLANRRGLEYFKRGYYQQMPHGRKTAAHQDLKLAEKAFQKAIDINGNYIDAVSYTHLRAHET